MSGQRLMVLKVKADNKELDTMPGSTIDIGGPVRKVEEGDGKVMGFTETVKGSRVDIKISVGVGTSLDYFRKMKDVTLTVLCDTKQVYSIPHAFSCDPAKIQGGGTPLAFEGDPAEEVVGA